MKSVKAVADQPRCSEQPSILSRRLQISAYHPLDMEYVVIGPVLDRLRSPQEFAVPRYDERAGHVKRQ
jgi:hypothetical protein